MKHLNDHHSLFDNQWGFTRGKSTVGALLTTVDTSNLTQELIFVQYFLICTRLLTVSHIGYCSTNYLDQVLVPTYCSGLPAISVKELRLSVQMELSRYQLCPGFHKDPCWGHYCSLSALMMSLKLCCPMAVYFFMLMTLSSTVPSFVRRTTTLFNDVDSLCDWTSSASLNLNAAKCKYMVISRKKQPIVPLTPILICGNAVERVNSFKYLGVGSLKTSLGRGMLLKSVLTPGELSV